MVDKIYEPLQAVIKAFNSKIAVEMELPKKLQEYSNPREEKINLVVQQHMIREAHSTFEGPPLAITRGHVSLKPTLETIPEASSSMEKGSEPITLPPFDEDPLPELEPAKPFMTADFGDEIPKVEEAMAREMWEVVKKHAEENESLNKYLHLSLLWI